MNISEALAELDGMDDDQWTADGAPKIDAVSGLVGDKVSRQDIIDAAPEFSRENMVLPQDEKNSLKTVSSEEPVASDKDILLKERAELEASVSEMKDNLKQAKIQMDKWNARLGKIYDELIIIDPPLTPNQRIRNFIDSSNAARAKRHANHTNVLASLPKSAHSVGTPLDNAFERKNKRGATRPTR